MSAIIPTRAGGVAEYMDFNFRTGEEVYVAPVVLIPGLGCTWRVWSKQIRELCRDRRVVAINCRGSGASSGPEATWTIADLAADVRDVIDHLQLERPDIVGLSMGGTVALQYALDNREILNRLVVIASFAALPPTATEGVLAELDRIRRDSPRVTAQRRMDVAFTPGTDPLLKAWAVEMIAAMNVKNYERQAVATFNFNVGDRLSQITAPTTVVAGAADRTVPIALVKAVADGIAGASFVTLPAHGHFANLEAPDLFNPILARALGCAR